MESVVEEGKCRITFIDSDGTSYSKLFQADGISGLFMMFLGPLFASSGTEIIFRPGKHLTEEGRRKLREMMS